MIKPMIMDAGKEITAEIVKDYIKQHEVECVRYKRLEKLYVGEHEILTQDKKETHKPDNRLIVNFAKYITDTFVGFFIGIPIKKKYVNEKEEAAKSVKELIQQFDDEIDAEDGEYELAKMACIYGRAYEYAYQTEDGTTKVIYNSPLDMFVVYDDTVEQNPLWACRYSKTEDNIKAQVFTLQLEYALNNDLLTEVKKNIYGKLPIYEFIHNEERMSIFEPVESLINAMNKGFSEKANDVDYFADAYLAILGADLDDNGVMRIKDNRIINLSGGDDAAKIVVKFLEKPNADTTQENYLDRLERFIYHISMVANISDETFGSSSGTALAYKLQAMSNLALTMQRKFVASLKNRYELFFSLQTNVPVNLSREWKSIEYAFTENMPRNILEETTIARNLEGVVSKETQLSALSIVPDVKTEIQRMENEDKKTSVYDNASKASDE